MSDQPMAVVYPLFIRWDIAKFTYYLRSNYMLTIPG